MSSDDERGTGRSASGSRSGKGVGHLMNSSFGYMSTRNLDKTHLANPMIAPSGDSPAADAIPLSRSRSSRRQTDSLGAGLHSSRSFDAESEEERISRYNSSSHNGLDDYGVGYVEENKGGSGAQVTPGRATAAPPSHQDVSYKVMGHNFGKAKVQIHMQSSPDSAQDVRDSPVAASLNPGSLEAAYLSKRDAGEVESLKKRSGSSWSGSSRGGHECEGKRAAMELISEEQHEDNLRRLSTLDLEVWDLSQEELVGMAWTMFHDAGLVEEFQIPAEKFENFVRAVFATAHDVPYHNHYHYFVVLHTSWLLLRTNPIVMQVRTEGRKEEWVGPRADSLPPPPSLSLYRLQKNLTKTDLLGCFVGAIGHDADHPGLTNSFLSITRHWLSVRYNDLSVLENHHCATTYDILSRPECNVLCNLNPEDWKVRNTRGERQLQTWLDLAVADANLPFPAVKATRNVVISAILNTDMARHFNLVANFDKMFRGRTTYECCANRNLRNQIVSMVVHCADISNPVKPWPVCRKFADSVAEEFRRQVRLEKKSGVPCTPHMLGLNQKGQAKMELGFIDVFTWPAMVALNEVLPNLEGCFQNMERNRDAWQEVLDNPQISSRTSSRSDLSG